MVRLYTDRYDLPLENTHIMFQARPIRQNILGGSRLAIELQMHLMSDEYTVLRTYDLVFSPREIVNLIADITAATQRLDDMQSGKGAS